MGTVVETQPPAMGIHASHAPQDSTGTFGGGGGPAQHAGKGLLASLSSSSTAAAATAHPASVHFALDDREAARRDHIHSKVKGNGVQGAKGASAEANSATGASSSKATPRPPKPKTQSSMPTTSSNSSIFAGAADSAWGANFWVTLVEPQVRFTASCCLHGSSNLPIAVSFHDFSWRNLRLGRRSMRAPLLVK